MVFYQKNQKENSLYNNQILIKKDIYIPYLSSTFIKIYFIIIIKHTYKITTKINVNN